MRVGISGIFRDYPSWRKDLSEYIDSPWNVVALRDVYQRVAGWVRSQELNRHRSPLGGSGWSTKANQLEKSHKTQGETNAILVRRFDKTRSDVNQA